MVGLKDTTKVSPEHLVATLLGRLSNSLVE
jgi:hypothetical protein